MAEKASKKDLFAPTIVLVSICLVASMLLAATYRITEPIIEEIAIKNANEARAEVLPEGDSFTKIENVELVEFVDEVYKADNGAGYAITATTKGFGGPVTVMVGLSSEGKIIGVKVTDASKETPGLGSKATAPSYTDGFLGMSAITNDKNDASAAYVAPVTGATYSSKAVFNALKAALDQYARIGGGI
ncbi:MAG: RnfABCDGE type electron transport complex subunit G [Clostridiales bacterium]|nr:RnfABCDGE type electron transport complex subunit G [Clostridiales bacterium]